jgi:hypothetical protein
VPIDGEIEPPDSAEVKMVGEVVSAANVTPALLDVKPLQNAVSSTRGGLHAEDGNQYRYQ